MGEDEKTCFGEDRDRRAKAERGLLDSRQFRILLSLRRDSRSCEPLCKSTANDRRAPTCMRPQNLQMPSKPKLLRTTLPSSLEFASQAAWRGAPARSER